MSEIRQSTSYNRQKSEGCGCEERDNATQNSINAEKKKICDELYASAGKVSMLEQRFKGENRVFEDKKCLFTKTEANYQRFRNLDMFVGSELIQTNESIKTNVAGYTKNNKDLNALLKNLAQGIRNVKTKFADLADAACKLESCLNDSCNSSQRKAITGSAPGCNGEPIEACRDSETIIQELICRPKGLSADIDSIFKSSFDVVGIQKFSNIDSLEPMQANLSKYAKDFVDHISGIMKARDADVRALQSEIVKSVQDITRAAMERNHERSNFEGLKDTSGFVCCPPCDCVVPVSYNDCGGDMKKLCEQLSQPMLKKCEKVICDICVDVQKAFCCQGDPPPPKEAGC